MSALAASRIASWWRRFSSRPRDDAISACDALGEALAHRLGPARRIGVGGLDQRRRWPSSISLKHRGKRLSLAPARRGERGDRLIEARERARAGRVHGRLVVLGVSRLDHAAQGEQSVHGRRREPGLGRGRAGGDGDRFERRQIDSRRGRRRPRAARTGWRSRSRAPSALASRVRASPSARSKGAGMRKRISRPLALTVLSSNVQRHVPPLPAARANPVMLLTGHRLIALRRLDRQVRCSDREALKSLRARSNRRRPAGSY